MVTILPGWFRLWSSISIAFLDWVTLGSTHVFRLSQLPGQSRILSSQSGLCLQGSSAEPSTFPFIDA